MVGTLVGGCRFAMSLCDLDLTFDLVIVTLSLKPCLGYFFDSIRCRRLTLGRDFG